MEDGEEKGNYITIRRGSSKLKSALLWRMGLYGKQSQNNLYLPTYHSVVENVCPFIYSRLPYVNLHKRIYRVSINRQRGLFICIYYCIYLLFIYYREGNVFGSYTVQSTVDTQNYKMRLNRKYKIN